MMRVAIVAGPDPGHAYPALGVAAALADRGHEVVVATGPRHRDAVARLGCRFEPLPLLAPTADDDDLAHRLWHRAGEMAPPLARQLRACAPDVLVVDTLTRAGAFAADLLDVPWVELVPHHLTDVSRDLPPIGLGRRPSGRWWRRLDDRRLRALQERSVAAGRAAAAEVARRLGVDPSRRPAARLVATLPGLEYPRSDWPADAHVVGAVAWDPDLPPLPLPPGDDPLVVVTDSTASAVTRSLAAVAVDALRDVPVRIVVTTDRTGLAAPPGTVIGRGPHGPLLDAATVALGFGGHGFLTKALSRGVPVVVVPLQGDQREAAARVRWAGVGRVIAPARLSPRRLRWEVLRVLHDPSYRRAAARIAAGARGLGPAAAVATIEAAAQPRGS